MTIFTHIASAEASESDSLLDINTWIEQIQEWSRLISGVVLILGARSARGICPVDAAHGLMVSQVKCPGRSYAAVYGVAGSFPT